MIQIGGKIMYTLHFADAMQEVKIYKSSSK